MGQCLQHLRPRLGWAVIDPGSIEADVTSIVVTAMQCTAKEARKMGMHSLHHLLVLPGDMDSKS